jgi:hypothetical protein
MSDAFLSEAALATASALLLDFINYALFLYDGSDRLDYFTILYIPVPQVVHLPFNAWRLFFIVTFWVSFISFLDLHFTQYPISAIKITSF